MSPDEAAAALLGTNPFEVAAGRTRQAVQPHGGRQEGYGTKFLDATGTVLAKQPMVQAATLPQRLTEASEDMRTGGGYDAGPATEMMMALWGANAPFVQPGAAGIFGGRLRSRTADHGEYKRAQAMHREGMDPETIRRVTGWHKGADNELRYEINDQASQILDMPTSSKFPMPMEKVLRHDELYAAYPELAQAPVLKFPNEPQYADMRGSVAPNGWVYLNPKAMKVHGTDPRSVMLHEAQHLVQGKEGFARGGTAQEFLPQVYDPKELERLVTSAQQKFTKAGFPQAIRIAESERQFLNTLGGGPHRVPSDVAAYLQRMKEAGIYGDVDAVVRALSAARGIEKVARDKYRSLAGEVEARNVDARRPLSAERRRELSPESTQDIPYDQQLVIKHPPR